MFILTNISVSNDLVQIFDTKDGSNDVVRLSLIANPIKRGTMKVHGLGAGSSSKTGVQNLGALGIYVDKKEAQKALYAFYQKQGYSREQSQLMAGFS